jgi:hypothetical protein
MQGRILDMLWIRHLEILPSDIVGGEGSWLPEGHESATGHFYVWWAVGGP